MQSLATTIQKDLGFMYNCFVGRVSFSGSYKESNLKKLQFAACRIIAALGMTYATVRVLAGIVSFPVSPFSSFYSCLLAAGMFVLTHDVFMIAKNKEATPLGQLANVGKNVLNSLIKGDAPHSPLLTSTIAPIFWETINIEKYLT